MLTVGEVLDGLPRLHAELVVLGACQTGLGISRTRKARSACSVRFWPKGA